MAFGLGAGNMVRSKAQQVGPINQDQQWRPPSAEATAAMAGLRDSRTPTSPQGGALQDLFQRQMQAKNQAMNQQQQMQTAGRLGGGMGQTLINRGLAPSQPALKYMIPQMGRQTQGMGPQSQSMFGKPQQMPMSQPMMRGGMGGPQEMMMEEMAKKQLMMQQQGRMAGIGPSGDPRALAMAGMQSNAGGQFGPQNGEAMRNMAVGGGMINPGIGGTMNMRRPF